MSKIVRAVNAMISSQDRISDIMKQNKEYYFLYGNKYKWSLAYDEDENGYRLYFYPGKQLLEDIRSMPLQEWQHFNEFIIYNTRDMGTKESLDSFRELYSILGEKVFGVDVVLDDIIDDIPF